MYVSRYHWDVFRKNIGYRGSKLYLIIASMYWAKAPYYTLKHTDYKKKTGSRLNNFEEMKVKMIEAIESTESRVTKSYIQFDPDILKIPTKNTFQLKVKHYVTTKQHDSKKPAYTFEEFAGKYNVTITRKNKYKFNKIIKSL